MTKLHLGVLVIPYSTKGGTTTGDVARFLEDRYGILETYWKRNATKHAGQIAQGVARAIEANVRGLKADPYGKAMGQIENGMKDFISSRAVERVGIPGVPTEAALKGVSHRKAHPYAKGNPRRPSFRDTGLYQSSLKAWVETK